MYIKGHIQFFFLHTFKGGWPRIKKNIPEDLAHLSLSKKASLWDLLLVLSIIVVVIIKEANQEGKVCYYIGLEWRLALEFDTDAKTIITQGYFIVVYFTITSEWEADVV